METFKKRYQTWTLQTSDDQLEKLALEETFKKLRFEEEVNVLIFTSDSCDLAIKFAKMGAKITLVTEPAKEKILRSLIAKENLSEAFEFLTMKPQNNDNISQFIHLVKHSNKTFDLVFIRHFICKMNYAQAGFFLEDILHCIKIGAKLYMTTYGIHSELSQNYPHIELSVQDRFCPIAPNIAKKYDIKEPICLYSERDLILLLIETGCSVLRSWISSYGNVQSVAVRI